MKYLKLFENFNSEDDLEEIKWILVELDNNPELLRNELDGNFLLYKLKNNGLNENYSDEELETAKKRLLDIGYKLSHINYGRSDGDIFVIIKSEHFDDVSIRGILIQFLKEKFGKLKKVDDNRAINYVDDNSETIIRFYKQRDKGDNYLINNDLVWWVFNAVGFSYNSTQDIISIWLKESYNLTGMAPFSWVPKPNRN
jgi:hypothetical protein